ncbi:MAG: hypothetical protein WCT19_02545 [Candidatus Paceibacterota bacterium]|jgi:hypothetical protein
MFSMIHFFDKLEDHVRARLSRHPMTYAFIGGIGIVLFWRGVWDLADQIEILNGFAGAILTIAVSTVILMMTGIFVSFFITDRIILSGMKREKKLVEKTEEEIEEEEAQINVLIAKLERIENELRGLKEEMKK